MDIFSFTPDILASILNITDGSSITNLMCTSKAMCQFVRSLRDRIHINTVVNFIENLPYITGIENECKEQNVNIFNKEGQVYDSQYTLYGKGHISFSQRYIEFVEIRCPIVSKYYKVIIGQFLILEIDETMMLIFDKDEYFDIMNPNKYLPTLQFHDIRIYYDIGDNQNTLFTTVRKSKHYMYNHLLGMANLTN